MENHSFEFGMEEKTDPNARLEFQLGNISASSIWIDNVKVEAIGKNTVKFVDPAVWLPNPNKIVIPEIKNRERSCRSSNMRLKMLMFEHNSRADSKVRRNSE